MEKQIPAREYEEVNAVANIYIDGMKNSDWSILASAFRETASVYAHISGKWTESNMHHLHEMLENYPKVPDFTHNVSVISMTPVVAVVRIEIDYVDTFNPFTDFITMAKVDGKWQIVSKASCEYTK
ncbi:hypothetical protein N7462_010491 [Penicillium macrosclerotiorum]|uniref:uncharacterized protein n=1 Tax=Penicillium macrosclerotiorum TaxID=303699 RepID=UPI002549408B|nr:uncharacterized protein N7462_010491 [Penicillium macrosclerotiorum]KAJ5669421.1 hypothetical protein N7462_010491 [Penicillium macrosclerotiorum]